MRTRRSVLSFGTGALYTAVTVATGLLATPLLLRWLGEECFGAFRAANDWLGYLSLLEFGTSGALLVLLAEATGRRDASATRETLALAVRWYLGIAAASVALGVGLAVLIVRLVPVRAELAGDLRRGSLIGLVALLALPLWAPFRALTESRQRSYVINLSLLGQALLTTALALVFARIGWAISGQFLALVLGGVPLWLAVSWRGLSGYPGVLRDAVRGPAAPGVRQKLLRLSAPTFVINLCGRVGLSSDNIIIAMLLGPASVVPFFITQRLAALVQVQLQGIGGASWAALAELHYQDQSALFARRVTELTGLIAMLGVAALAPIVVFNEYFVRLWVGGQRYGGHWLSAAAAAVAFLQAIASFWGWCLHGTGRVRQQMYPLLAQTGVNLTASLVFTWRLGLPGPLLGSLLGLASVSTWYFPTLLRRELGVPAGRLRAAAAGPLILGAPYAAGLRWLVAAHPPTTWLGLAAGMLAVSAVPLAFWWLVMLDGDERASFRERARLTLRRRPM